MTRRETLLAASGAIVVAALVLFEALFLGRSTLAFGESDPRIGIAPWVTPFEGAPPLINPITPDSDLFILPGEMRSAELRDLGVGTDWDDGQLCGAPFAANLAWPEWSPLAWIVRPLPPVTALDVMLWLHLAAGGFLAYRLARLLGVGAAAAAFAAVGFAGSAWMYTHWHASPIFWTSVWWPGQLAVIERLRRGLLRRAMVEGALFTAMLLVAGFPQVGILLTGATFALLLVDGAVRTGRNLAAFGVAAVIGLALASPQLVRSSAAYEESLRASDETRAATASRGLPAGALFGLVLPEFFGRPSDFSTEDAPAPRMEDWLPNRLFLGDPLQNNPVENALYPGAAVLLLLIVGFRREVDARARRFLLAGGAAIVLAWAGPHLVAAWSGFERLGAANVKRVLAVAGGAWPFAAALALDALLRGKVRLPRVVPIVLIAGLVLLPWGFARLDDPMARAFAVDLGGQVVRLSVFLVLAALAFAAARRDPRLRWLPAFVLLLELALLARAFNPFPVERPPFPRTEAIAMLQERPGRYVPFAGLPRLVPAPAGAVHGLRCAIGMLPMVPRRTAELLECIESPLFDRRDPRVADSFQEIESLSHPVLDLLGVDTVLIDDPAVIERSGLEVAFALPEEGLGALDRPTALPRAFLLGGARVVSDAAERLAMLRDRSFDPRATAWLESSPGIALPERGEFAPAVQVRHAVSEHELVFDAAFPGIAVLSESWDPGWSVTIDGQPHAPLIVDHALLGVALPAGRHVVRFTYHAKHGAAARWAALLAALALLALVAVPRPGLLPSPRESGPT